MLESSKRDSDRTKSKDRSERAKERSKDDSKKRAAEHRTQVFIQTRELDLVSKLSIVYYSRHDHSEGKEEEEHSPVVTKSAA